MKQGVFLLAHGAPQRVEDVPEYLGYVRGGRPPSQAIVDEVTHRYTAIGGASPLTCWTMEQAQALEKVLGIPVFFGMRNWHPFITESMECVTASGIEKLAAVCLAPQYSDMSVGLYIKRTEEAGFPGQIVWAKSYHDEPLLIEAFADNLKQVWTGQKVLFTAHSLPEKILATDDPYDRETRETAALVAAKAGVTDWDFAYQSQGMTGDKWLGPTVEATLDRYAADGVKQVVLDPIGFVCDHVEVLFDVDVLFKQYAAARGIELIRPDSLNGCPKFTAALAEVARRCL
ncbi:MAG TPA: ferrochelatase [Candidatus Limnocylindrales bacterium]|nr:ferrochelatase [Candidatus Limnocylindrales bacterium]